jgi:hypothetical protein
MAKTKKNTIQKSYSGVDLIMRMSLINKEAARSYVEAAVNDGITRKQAYARLNNAGIFISKLPD